MAQPPELSTDLCLRPRGDSPGCLHGCRDERADLYDVARARGDNDLAVAGVDGDVAAFHRRASPDAAGEDEVAGAELVEGDLDADEDLLLGGAGEVDADLPVGPLGEA